MSTVAADKPWYELSDEEARAILVELGHDPDLPPRGVAEGTPPPGLRNHVCRVDGHSDPDWTGLCIYCRAEHSEW